MTDPRMPRVEASGRPRRGPALFAQCLVVTITACRGPVGVEPVGFDEVYRQSHGHALTSGEPSSFSVGVLRRVALEEAFDDDPAAALDALHDRALGSPDHDTLFALAELWYLIGRETHDRAAFLTSVCYAWFYLFGGGADRRPGAFDPRFRIVCDLYNRSLARAFMDDEGAFVVQPGELPLSRGVLTLAVDDRLPEWDIRGGESAFTPAGRFELRGLANRHRRPGLGAPLVVSKPSAATESVSDMLSHPRVRSATAVVRIEGDLHDLEAGRLAATLLVEHPLLTETIDVDGVSVPLETDTSVTIGHALDDARLFDLELPSFLGGEDFEDFSGLYVVRPYVADKIPVVLIHGTSSSLARWADMINDLTADPLIRRHCQFWFFTYLSGRPIIESSNLLRRSLHDARREFDPGHDDRAFDQMVLIGHSQGGLLARMMVVDDPEHALWRSVFVKPLDEITAPDEMLANLREGFFSPPVPFVTRAIYIATPHRGSFLADRWIARLVESFISLPSQAVRIVSDLVRLNPGAFRRAPDERAFTSVDSMRTDNPLLLTLTELAASSGVRQHTIAAIDGDEEPPDGDDGVVSYRSARLEDVDSELVVRSFHSCQAQPPTIGEVRRLLREHLAEVRPGALSDGDDTGQDKHAGQR